MRIQKASVQKLKAKLIYPFRTAPGQHDDLTNVLIGIQLENGIRGFGEAAIATHITGETVEQTFKNLSQLKPFLIGQDIEQLCRHPLPIPPPSRRRAWEANPCALAAVEMAVLDVFSQNKKVPFWRLFGKSTKKLETDMTVVLGTVEEAKKAALEIRSRGIKSVKVKVGRNEEEDLRRVFAVSKILRNVPLYLDANQGYSAKQALWFLARLLRYKIFPVLIEQPVAKDDWDGLRFVTKKSGITVIADETVSSYEDALRLAKGRYAHGINIKFMKSGILESIRIAKLAKKNDLKLMIGGMMETELGTTASAHFASAFGFDYIDLDSQFFLKTKVMNSSFVSKNGVYNLRNVRSGIGIEPKRNIFR